MRMDIAREQLWFAFLLRQNPWWQNEPVGDVPGFKRRDYGIFWKKLHSEANQALVVTGVRQVGKTTLLKQLVNGLLEDGVPPESILYVDFEGAGVELLSDRPLVEALDVFQKYALKGDARKSGKQVYVFLDEVHKAGEWARVLKIWVDSSKNVRFVVSGSSRQELFKASSETLPGRHVLYALSPLKLLDAVQLKLFMENPSDPKLERLGNAAGALREALKTGIENDSPETIFEAFGREAVSLALDQVWLDAAFHEYLLKGGYPEVVKKGTLRECAELLDGYARDIIIKDVPLSFPIRNTAGMDRLMRYFARISGQKVNWHSTTELIGITDQRTVKAYAGFLSQLLVISLADYYSASPVPGMRKNPKVHFNDPGLRNLLASEFVPGASAESMPHIVESTVFDHCVRLASDISEGAPAHPCYWEGKQGYEVDVILLHAGKRVPIEVKFSSKVKASELRGMNYFREEFGSKTCIVVTKDELAYRDGIIFIPCWLFLLAV